MLITDDEDDSETVTMNEDDESPSNSQESTTSPTAPTIIQSRDVSQEPSTSTGQQGEHVQPGKHRKCIANTSIDPVDQHLLNIILQNSKPPPQQAKQPVYDDKELFCLSLSHSLKKLAPPQ